MTPIVTVVGWTLIHFVWQGSLVALVVAGLLQGLARPQARYLVACAGLALMLAAPIATLGWAASGDARRMPTVTEAEPTVVNPVDAPGSAAVRPRAPLDGDVRGGDASRPLDRKSVV